MPESRDVRSPFDNYHCMLMFKVTEKTFQEMYINVGMANCEKRPKQEQDDIRLSTVSKRETKRRSYITMTTYRTQKNWTVVTRVVMSFQY